MSWRLDGRPLRSILITRLRYLGDVVMTTVVLEALRRGDSDLELGYLCEAACAPLLRDDPRLARLHLLAIDRRGADAAARRSGSASEGGVGTLGTLAALRRARYDAAVDLFFNPRSAWLLRLSGVPRRIGSGRGSRRRLYTHLSRPPDPAADPDFAAAAPGGLGEHLGRLLPLVHAPTGLSFRDWLVSRFPRGIVPRLTVRPEPGAQAALAAAGVAPGAPYTLLAPGATWPAKGWAAKEWGTLAAELSAEGRVVVLAPPGGDQDLAEALTAATGGRVRPLPPLPLAGALTVIRNAARVVSVDGAAAHASVACGRPTVALFGPTDPAVWFPYESLGPYRVLCTRPFCHPCDRHVCPPAEFVCMPGIKVADVVEALAGLTSGGRAS